MKTTNELGPLPIEHTSEYDAAAEHYARTAQLPDCMGSPGALDWINADPEAFFSRVNEFHYAFAMELSAA
jgi:hypothetical protein